MMMEAIFITTALINFLFHHVKQWHMTPLLDSLSTNDGGVSVVWFAGICFTIALSLIAVVWKQQVEQQKSALAEQKEQTKLIKTLCEDLAVIKNTSTNTNEDVARIRDDVDEIRREVVKIDKRVVQLEAIK